MKKNFETPEIEIYLLEIEEIMYTSNEDDLGPNETPEW